MKEMIIIVPKGAAGYNELFPKFKSKEVNFGYTRPDFEELKGLCRWLTTYPVPQKNLPAGKILDEYPAYDNYDAIEVRRICYIPDYPGKMGVPVTIFEYDLSGYDVLGIMKGEYSKIEGDILAHQGKINGKSVFTRIIIKRNKGSN